MEPIAIIILAVVMAVSSLFVMKEAIELLVHYARTPGGGNNMGIATIVICCVTIGQFLMFYIYSSLTFLNWISVLRTMAQI